MRTTFIINPAVKLQFLFDAFLGSVIAQNGQDFDESKEILARDIFSGIHCTDASQYISLLLGRAVNKRMSKKFLASFVQPIQAFEEFVLLRLGP